MSKKRLYHLSIALILALLTSAMAPLTVFADAGTPPPPDDAAGTELPEAATTTDVSEPTPQAEPTEETVQEEAGEVPPVEQPESTSPPEGDGEVSDGPEETNPPEAAQPIMERVPEDTAIVVINSEGEPEPLVTQGAADAVKEGDPIWCPAGQAATPGENGCTDSFTSFDELLSFLQEHEGEAAFQQAGTIFIEMGDYTGSESSIDFNNYTFTTFNTFDLTLQGGWNTAEPTVEPTTETETRTNFTAPVIIGSALNPWMGSISVNQFNIFGVNGFSALTIYSQGNITVSNSEFNENKAGLDLNAGGDVTVESVQADNNKNAGATINAGGNVAIQDSSFSGNNSDSSYTATGKGVEIVSQGDVSLVQVQANNNQLFGANIQAAGLVEISSSIFSGNKGYTCSRCGGKQYYGYGLQVVTTDTIYLEDVVASDNNLYGAKLVSDYDVVISNGEFNHNGVDGKAAGFGLEIDTAGYAILDEVQANNNQLFGADIEAVYSVFISNSVFSGNRAYTCSYCGGKDYYGYGLKVVSTEEGIGLSGVTASDNNLYGAYLQAASNVDIFEGNFNNNGVNTSSYATGYGLQIESGDEVSLYRIEANGNKLFGASINAVGMVNISSSIFSGNKASTCSYCGGKKSYGYGLQVVSLDNIALSEVTAENNNLFGVDLDAAGDVSIYQGQFSGNGLGYGGYATGYGMNVKSGGDVAVSSVTASNNYLYGANIEAAGSVSLSTSVFSGNQYSYVTHCGCSQYYGYGLHVLSGEDISVYDVKASDNNLYGAYLKANGNVDIYDGVFDNNGVNTSSFVTGKGLEIESGANVSLYLVQANNNMLAGADIQAIGTVSVSYGMFSGNKAYTSSRCSKQYYGYGLQIITLDAVTLTDITAEENNQFGARVETDGDVSVSNSSFSNNGVNTSSVVLGYGLEILNGGNVSLDGVTANENKLFGANIESDGAVSVINSDFSRNRGVICSHCRNTFYGFGLRVVAEDVIDLSGVTANENYQYGADLNTAANVNVFESTFNKNGYNTNYEVGGYGLEITSGGDVILDGVTANENVLYGASIDAAGGVSITDSEFSLNRGVLCTRCGKSYFGYGFIIKAQENIEISNVIASQNYRNGGYIEAAADLTITNSTFNGNGYYRNGYSGLSIVSSGQVTLTNVEASGNANNGVYIEGNRCTSVVVDGGVYTNNGAYGINIYRGSLVISGSPVFSGNRYGNKSVYAGNCAP